MKKSLFESLREYGESDYYPFHMPGHKRNPASGPLHSFYQYDITEIDGFDNLHQPEGIIKAAQERAAQLYHSEETYFLVNGSTVGILSAISAISGRGKKLIVARNCHKAVYHAAFLNRLEMEYIYPNMITDYELADGISKSQVEEKLKEIEDKENIAGIILTSPTYDGIVSDVSGIVDLAHHYHIPVIVDQAHGAHFGFHSSFPKHAVKEGADLVIHSVHKTLPAPTQTALLHRNGTLVDGEILRKYLRIYQSSSPSYLLMAGIDSCIELLEKEGKKRLDELLTFRTDFMKETNGLKYIHIFPSMLETGAYKDSVWESEKEEPGRLVISVYGSGLTGQQLYDRLRQDYHIQMEMYGADYVVAILSIMDQREGLERLSKALIEIDEGLAREEQRHDVTVKKVSTCFLRPEHVLDMSETFVASYKSIVLTKAEGQIASDFVNLYPPGIPLLVPGERIDTAMIHLIEQYLKNGYTLQGIFKEDEQSEYKIKVIL